MLAKNFLIYRSSAGSGKTYVLTREYLGEALKSPQNFRHLLAVTFTNKATHEMKSRILQQLRLLATGNLKDRELLEHLAHVTGLGEAELQVRATIVLQNMLHGYADFAVTTIDSFFQKIIRSFAREVGLQGGFKIELDLELVQNSLIDNLLEDLGQNKDLTRWLISFAEQQLEAGKSWDIRKEIGKLAGEIFKEEYKATGLGTRENLGAQIRNLQNLIYQRIGMFETYLETKARAAIDILEQSGFTPSDFSYGKSGVIGYFFKIISHNFDEIPKRALACMESPDQWCTAKSPLKNQIFALVDQHLMLLLTDCISYHQANLKSYLSLKQVARNYPTFAILNDLALKLVQYRDENEVMLISDSNDFLQEIVAQNDSPFIYEKTGSRFHHFLIDEFQDTSSFQWGNFKPLVINSLAEGKGSMVVGDVKQSIYRWRGGDWQLLLERLQQEITGEQVKALQLDINWRSREHIIRFNNRLFQLLPESISDFLDLNFSVNEESLREILRRAYRDGIQNLPEARGNSRDGGYVAVKFYPNGNEINWQDLVLEQLPAQLELLQDQGFQPREIAILVRYRREGRMISEYLMNYRNSEAARPGYSYNVLSSETLFLDQSVPVKLLLNVFRFLYNPEDQLAIRNFIFDYSLQNHQQEDIHQVLTGTTKVVDQILLERSNLLQMPLFEMGAWLVRFLDLDHDSENTGYVFSFQQQLLDYTFQNRSDLAGFLEWWEQTGCKVSIPMSGELNACRIMTIHTAKGLQFKNVIIPFCDWPLDHGNGRQPILWCQNRLDILPEISHFPLNYSTGLKGTFMQDDYLAERYRITLDNLNLLYVALTRAEDQLFLHVPAREGSKANPNIAEFLHRLFLDAGLEFDNSTWNAETQEFRMGEPVVYPDRRAVKDEFDIFPPRRVTPWQQRIRIRRSNQALLDLLAPELADKIRYGNLIHQILSRVDYADNLPTVLDIMVQTGWLARESLDAMKLSIGELLAKPDIGKFFDRKWEVKNELPIISPEGQVRRPDRVIIQNDLAVVIDYKTGEEKSADHRQVSNYMELLRQMGYREVEGYILYLERGELERINR